MVHQVPWVARQLWGEKQFFEHGIRPARFSTSTAALDGDYTCKRVASTSCRVEAEERCAWASALSFCSQFSTVAVDGAPNSNNASVQAFDCCGQLRSMKVSQDCKAFGV